MTLPPVLKKNILFLVFAQALIGMLGSLYFSEIKNLAPCILCWYQRIALYPVALISGVGIWFDERLAYRYILPFSIVGSLIAAYHNLLYYGVIPEEVAPCTFGISCTAAANHQVGFITIPMLSLLAFLVITVCALIQRNTARQEQAAA